MPEKTHIRKGVRDIEFNMVLEKWLDNNRIRIKGSSQTKYEYLIRTHIAPQLGKVKIREISATIINEFLRVKLESGRLDGQGGLSPSYIRSMQVIIRSAISFATAEGLCETLRGPIFKPPIIREKLTVLTRENQRVLESFLIDNIDPVKLGILISLHTGLRIGEICALTWKDIDWDENLLCVRHTVTRIRSDGYVNSSFKMILDNPKTLSSVREIPISSFLKPFMLMIQGMSTSQFVISCTDSFVSPRTYEYKFHKILEACGVEQINYHVLRHTFATRCIEVGVDAKTLSELLGHATVTMTLNTYVHSSMELKRAQLEKLKM